MGIKVWIWQLFNRLFKSNPVEYNVLPGIKMIKTATRHAKAIHALEKECFSDPWSIQSLKYEITHPQSVCLVAMSDNHILGHIMMLQVLDEGHIHNIAVAEQARRQGIGRALLEAVISEARALGIKSLTLEVRSQNNAAISLYKKLGFETRGLRKNYYHTPTDDALVMVSDKEVLCEDSIGRN